MKIRAPFRVGKPLVEERRDKKMPCKCALHLRAFTFGKYLIAEFIHGKPGEYYFGG